MKKRGEHSQRPYNWSKISIACKSITSDRQKCLSSRHFYGSNWFILFKTHPNGVKMISLTCIHRCWSQECSQITKLKTSLETLL